MSDNKRISTNLARAMALFATLPVTVLPMAAQAQDKTTSGRRLRRVRNLRRDIGDLRTGLRIDSKIDTKDVVITDFRTDLRDFRTGIRDTKN